MSALADTAVTARYERGHVTIQMASGVDIRFPVARNPRLARGTPEQLSNIEISPYGLHWPDLDEDIGVEGLLLGKRSTESPASFERWLARRESGQ